MTDRVGVCRAVGVVSDRLSLPKQLVSTIASVEAARPRHYDSGHLLGGRMTLTAPGKDPKLVVLFRLINHSARRVKLTHVGLAPMHKGGMHIFIPHPLPLPAPGPFEVEARDSVQGSIEPEQLADGDPRWKTRALIATSDDRKFDSKKVRV